jgi:triosephosphate isomerase
MNGSRAMAGELIGALRRFPLGVVAEVVVCPPYPYLDMAQVLLRGSMIGLGAQDIHPEVEGAFTGDVSGAMLRDCGCGFVIVGHSERRQLCGESDALVADKAAAALREGLQPVVCVGESASEREAGEALAVVGRQLGQVLEKIGARGMLRAVLAYEPVWAIGTGRTATPELAQEMHAYLRSLLRDADPALADATRIVYGGSVKAANARALFEAPDIDGGLIGGAALKAEEFAAICLAAEGR